MENDKSKEIIDRIEEELTKSYNQYRYCKFSTGIELALDVVKRVAKEEGIETE